MTDVLRKAATGVTGLDQITEGGLPHGRPTLVCGAAGCGKTLLGLQFLVAGATEHDEPGVFVSFEESGAELATNVASLGWDLPRLQRDGLLTVEHVRVGPTDMRSTGPYDLEGLFVRLGEVVERTGAKRIVIDTLEVLFSALDDDGLMRQELQRLFGWTKAQGLTAVVTAERGEGTLSRHGLEEYVSDCVILLDHRVEDHVSTRRLRIVKYRGSGHSTDETPFMIDEHGFRVMPLVTLGLEHEASDERVSTGIPRLDTMLDGEGYYRGGSMLISGTPGSGKTTIAASFVAAGCARGERAVIFAFEESPEQLMRNQRSVGVDLRPHVDSGLLRIVSSRPSSYGLEAHLAMILRIIEQHDPQLVVVDPLSAFGAGAVEREAMLTRLVDLLKGRGITAVCTALVSRAEDAAGLGISSVIDAWISVAATEHNGERNRSLTIIKARGTRHSHQVREFILSSSGVDLVDVYTQGAEVLMGSARRAREAELAAEAAREADELSAKRHLAAQRRAAVDAQVAALHAQLAAELEVLEREIRGAESAAERRSADRAALAAAREGDDRSGDP